MDQNKLSPTVLPPPLTDRERLLWRIWWALVAFLVIGSLVLTALLMYFGPAPVTHRSGRGRARWDTSSVPTPVSETTPFQSARPSSYSRPTPPAGPGIVWVNTRSHIYHFPGYRWYGGTIQGKYAREQEALAEGDRAARNERRPANFDAWVPQ